MAKVRGTEAKFILGGNDLSSYLSSVSIDESNSSEDVTTFGNDSVRRSGTLNDGSISLDGFYETAHATPTDPRSVIRPMLGTVVDFEWYPEGMGGPKTIGDVFVASYNESSPVAGHITFSATLERDGDWTSA